jgi:hypothetical protein
LDRPIARLHNLRKPAQRFGIADRLPEYLSYLGKRRRPALIAGEGRLEDAELAGGNVRVILEHVRFADLDIGGN